MRILRAGLWATIGLSAGLCLCGCQQSSSEPTSIESPPAQTTASVQSSTPSLFALGNWGNAPGQFGRKRPSEAAPEGPMSLTVDAQGNVYVLDQVNYRVQRFSPAGSLDKVIPINTSTVQDLVVEADGTLVLLDRLADPSLTFQSPEGRVLARVPLLGNGVAEGGAVTGLFQYQSGIWVEVESKVLVRIADLSGRPDPDRPTLDGRPGRAGTTLLRAELLDAQKGKVRLQRQQLQSRKIRRRPIAFEIPVREIQDWSSDASGNLYLTAHLVKEQPDNPIQIMEERDSVVMLAEDGSWLGRVDFESSKGPEEHFRTVAVTDSGIVYHMHTAAQGLVLGRWTR